MFSNSHSSQQLALALSQPYSSPTNCCGAYRSQWFSRQLLVPQQPMNKQGVSAVRSPIGGDCLVGKDSIQPLAAAWVLGIGESTFGDGCQHTWGVTGQLWPAREVCCCQGLLAVYCRHQTWSNSTACRKHHQKPAGKIARRSTASTLRFFSLGSSSLHKTAASTVQLLLSW